MNYYIDVDEDGRIMLYASGDPPEGGKPAVGAVKRVTIGHAIDDFEHAYWHANAVHTMPPRPSPHHEFDYKARLWRLNGDKAWASVRRERDELLAGTDWVILRAQEQGASPPQAWADYRQALRDITDQPDPLNIEWPEPPV